MALLWDDLEDEDIDTAKIPSYITSQAATHAPTTVVQIGSEPKLVGELHKDSSKGDGTGLGSHVPRKNKSKVRFSSGQGEDGTGNKILVPCRDNSPELTSLIPVAPVTQTASHHSVVSKISSGQLAHQGSKLSVDMAADASIEDSRLPRLPGMPSSDFIVDHHVESGFDAVEMVGRVHVAVSSNSLGQTPTDVPGQLSDAIVETGFYSEGSDKPIEISSSSKSVEAAALPPEAGDELEAGASLFGSFIADAQDLLTHCVAAAATDAQDFTAVATDAQDLQIEEASHDDDDEDHDEQREARRAIRLRTTTADLEQQLAEGAGFLPLDAT